MNELTANFEAACPVPILAADARLTAAALEAADAAVVAGPEADRPAARREFNALEARLCSSLEAAAALPAMSGDGAMFQMLAISDRLQILASDHEVADGCTELLEIRQMVRSVTDWIERETGADIGRVLRCRFL